MVSPNLFQKTAILQRQSKIRLNVFFFQNANGLGTLLIDFQNFHLQCMYDVVMLCETNLFCDSKYMVILYIYTSSKLSEGGVLVAVRKSIFNSVLHLSPDQESIYLSP